MTVAELIAALSSLPPDLTVTVESDYPTSFAPIISGVACRTYRWAHRTRRYQGVELVELNPPDHLGLTESAELPWHREFADRPPVIVAHLETDGDIGHAE